NVQNQQGIKYFFPSLYGMEKVSSFAATINPLFDIVTAVVKVNENDSKYEENIKHQYTAFKTMVEQIQKYPEGREGYMAEFQRVYERDKDTLALDTYYSSVIEENQTFEQDVMEKKCSQLANIFRIGLMTLMAYTVVREDDEVEVRDKWAPRVEKIQAKMDEALAQCEGN
uniref:Uncharacterized protein n=1 Tax=Hucho hucho TaxID=62062 RepID=A0A4W5Q2Y6_9TELE